MELDISWDPVKAQANLTKHAVSFTQAATAMLDPLALSTFDAAHSDTEERWFTLGLSRDDLLLVIAHSYHVSGPASAKVRLISARTATRRERDQYQNLPQ